MIYIFATAFGLLSALDTPARQTFVYEMVGKEQLTNAVSLNGTLFNLTRIIGPAIAGILIATVGLSPCFYINAASFIAVLVALKFMDTSLLQNQPRAENAKGQIKEGFKYILSQPILFDVLLFMFIIGTFAYEFTVTIPLLAKTTFHGGVGVYALLTAAMGVGSVFGGLYAASRKQPKMINILWSILLLGSSMLITAVSSNLIFALLGLVLVGFASTSYTSRGNVILQLNSEPQMRGRVLALWNVALVGSTPVGAPIIGYVSEQLNPQLGFALGGLSTLVVLIYARSRLGQYNKNNI
jgi:MFS family permease